MCLGSSVKKTPFASDTTQNVTLPSWLTQGSQQAVTQAQNFASQPTPIYGGQLAAGLSDNQQAGTALANNSQTTGQGALANASNDFNSASNTAALTQNAGQGNMGSANVGANQATSLAGRSQGTGQTDLNAARAYNAASAGPITPQMIQANMNPFVQQSLDPVAAQLNLASGQAKNALDEKSMMSGAFGGARTGLEESQNTSYLLNNLQQLYGQGYLNAFNNAQSQAQAQLGREQTAAGTALNTASGANTAANDALSRLTQASSNQANLANTSSNLATNAVARDTAAGQNQVALGGAQQNQATQALNNLMTSGQVEQATAQNALNAQYQQWLNQQNYPLVQLNALNSTVSSVPTGSTTTADTSGYNSQVVGSPLAGLLGAAIGAYGATGGGSGGSGGAAKSDRDAKTDIAPAVDEDILERLSRVPVSTYRYKPGAIEEMGGRGTGPKIGPMAQDWAKEFGGSPKQIPMPEIIGVLVASVRALDRRTQARAA